MILIQQIHDLVLSYLQLLVPKGFDFSSNVIFSEELYIYFILARQSPVSTGKIQDYFSPRKMRDLTKGLNYRVLLLTHPRKRERDIEI